MDRSSWVEIKEDWVTSQTPQYAQIEGDDLVKFRGEPVFRYGNHGNHGNHGDDGVWLPIVNMDSRPFDYAKDYRLKPFLVRDGDRVCRVYPVISKFDHDARRAS